MAIANVVLNTKTYTFASDQSGIITWNETSGGIPTGFSKLTLALREPSKDGPFRLEMRLGMPVVAAVDSACSCTGEVLRHEDARVVVEIPQTGSTAERTDYGLRLKDLLANAQVQAALATLVRPN